ncbi:A4/G1 family peptidase, partial [Aspergillus saccharolyticus JOP 1030-1]
MKFTAAIAASILAGTVTAIPGRGVEARVKARSATRGSRPLEAVNRPATVKNQTNVEYSSNWSGAVLESPPSASATYTAVTGTFTVPEPTGTGNGAASAWVGIDGDTYGNAILQTGIDFTLENGQASYDAWYEWYPDYAYDFSGSLDISAGDEIVAIVESYSSTRGIATIENKSTGKSVSKTLSAPDSSAKLGGQNAEWIVEGEWTGDVSIADLYTNVARRLRGEWLFGQLSRLWHCDLHRGGCRGCWRRERWPRRGHHHRDRAVRQGG